MAYDIVESIKGSAVRRQFETLEESLERILTIDVEAEDNTDSERVDLTPTITMEVFKDKSQWDVEYAVVLRVGSDPYRFVWLEGDMGEFLEVALDNIDSDLNGIQQLRIIDGTEQLVSAVMKTEYAVAGVGTEADR